MKNQVKKLNAVLLLAVALVVAIITSCGDDNEELTIEGNAMIKLSSDANLGEVLTNANGETLYVFAKDVAGASTCLGGCLDTWPAFYAEAPALDAGLVNSDFGTITRSSGALQTTYKGWPLYYYAPTGDGVVEAAGSTSGDAVGGAWFVAKPNYTIMYAIAQLVGNNGKNYTSTYEEGEGATVFFVNAQGSTLYAFVNDAKDVNNYTASDFSNASVWPVYSQNLEAVASTLNSGDFANIDVFGMNQLTYKGWPLYYFGQDTKRGETKGVSVPSPGVWPIVNKNTLAAE
jgi:predicted lipoprotein with Yx(FWY)xxD motif